MSIGASTATRVPAGPAMLLTPRGYLETCAPFVRSCRRRQSNWSPRDVWLQTLARNSELDEESACDELRWMEERAKLDYGDASSRCVAVQSMVQARSEGRPLQYILGDTDLGPLNFLCRPPVLIPRPETAHVFERLAELWNGNVTGNEPVQMLDLYTGSGAIALLTSHLVSDTHLDRLVGVDLSSEAITLAQSNREYIQSQRPERDPVLPGGWRTIFRQADICSRRFARQALRFNEGRRYGLITANPPYISPTEWRGLPRSVKEHEDIRALSSTASWHAEDSTTRVEDSDGTEHYRTIARLLPKLLLSIEEMGTKGWAGRPRVATEIGAGQLEAVQGILKAESEGMVTRTECWQDQYGKDRLIVGWSG